MLLLFFFIATVVLAPLFLGGNIPIAWTLEAFVVGGLVLFVCLRGVLLRRRPRVPFKRFRVPSILFLAVCVWAWVQSLSLTPAMLHHPLWAVASDALGQDISGAISINPYETRTSLMRLITYGLVFWLAVQLGRDRSKADAILNAIAFAILAYSILGIVLLSVSKDSFLGFQRWWPADSATSTFANRNHFATFAGLGCVIFLTFLLRSMRGAIPVDREGRLIFNVERVMHSFSSFSSYYLFGLMVTLGALILSNSRAGLIFTLLALSVLIAIRAMRSRLRGLVIGAMIAIALGAFVVLFNLSGHRLSERFAKLDVARNERFAVHNIVLEAVGDAPWLGTGYGTFADVFPMYRDQSISSHVIWDRAHNTYLELLLELGLPGGLALLLAIGLCIWRCLWASFSRQRNSHIPQIGFAASVLVMTHSLVDFSLQIPGVTITYAALLGIGYTQSWSSRTKR